MRYLVQSSSKARTKRGKDYLRLKLYAPGGKLWNAVFWENNDVAAGQVIDALAEVSSYNNEEQLEVRALRVIAQGPTGDEFLPRGELDIGPLFGELRDFISSVTHRGIKQLLEMAVKDERLKRAPAGMKIHHAYLGGLLQHIVGLCRLVDRVVELYPTLRRDLLIAAAVLHDIGKLDELRYETNIDYSDEGQLLGHIGIGFLTVDRWMQQIGSEALPDDVQLLIKHIILSHHGQSSYGSPKSPQVLEAQAFSHLDGLDATLTSILTVIKATPASKTWTERASTGQPMYLGER